MLSVNVTGGIVKEAIGRMNGMLGLVQYLPIRSSCPDKFNLVTKSYYLSGNERYLVLSSRQFYRIPGLLLAPSISWKRKICGEIELDEDWRSDISYHTWNYLYINNRIPRPLSSFCPVLLVVQERSWVISNKKGGAMRPHKSKQTATAPPSAQKLPLKKRSRPTNTRR